MRQVVVVVACPRRHQDGHFFSTRRRARGATRRGTARAAAEARAAPGWSNAAKSLSLLGPEAKATTSGWDLTPAGPLPTSAEGSLEPSEPAVASYGLTKMASLTMLRLRAEQRVDEALDDVRERRLDISMVRRGETWRLGRGFASRGLWPERGEIWRLGRGFGWEGHRLSVASEALGLASRVRDSPRLLMQSDEPMVSSHGRHQDGHFLTVRPPPAARKEAPGASHHRRRSSRATSPGRSRGREIGPPASSRGGGGNTAVMMGHTTQRRRARGGRRCEQRRLGSKGRCDLI